MFRWLRDHGVIERNLILMGVLAGAKLLGAA